MRVVGHHAARLHMGIGQHLVHRQDGAGRNASGIAQRAQGIALEAGNRRRQSGHDFLAPRHPHRVARQFAVFGPARQAEQLAQRRPVLVAAGDVHELAVAAAEGGRGHPSGMLGAQARRHFAQGKPACCGQTEQGHLAIEHGEIDMAAAPGLGPSGQRRQQADHHPQPGAQVGHRQTGLDGSATLLAGEAHQSAHGLEHRVIALARGIRPALAKAGAGQIHQARTQRRQRRIVQPIAPERADREVLQQHIGLLRQLTDQRLAGGFAQVDRDRLLAAVEGQEIGRFAATRAADMGLEAARLVAAAGLLDLDDGRAQLGQDHRGKGAGQHPRQVQYRDAFEGFHRSGFIGRVSLIGSH